MRKQRKRPTRQRRPYVGYALDGRDPGKEHAKFNTDLREAANAVNAYLIQPTANSLNASSFVAASVFLAAMFAVMVLAAVIANA